jgi:hypothetical protein
MRKLSKSWLVVPVQVTRCYCYLVESGAYRKVSLGYMGQSMRCQWGTIFGWPITCIGFCSIASAAYIGPQSLFSDKFCSLMYKIMLSYGPKQTNRLL